jgi:hypothetical protein
MPAFLVVAAGAGMDPAMLMLTALAAGAAGLQGSAS